jgi:hypothetical protein
MVKFGYKLMTEEHGPNHPGTPRALQPRIAMGLRFTHQPKHPLRRRLGSKNQSDVQ